MKWKLKMCWAILRGRSVMYRMKYDHGFSARYSGNPIMVENHIDGGVDLRREPVVDWTFPVARKAQ